MARGCEVTTRVRPDLDLGATGRLSGQTAASPVVAAGRRDTTNGVAIGTAGGMTGGSGPSGAPFDVCTIRVGRFLLAIDVRPVVEVHDLGEVTPVPGAAPTVVGLVNLRSAVVPVVDLRAWLGGREPRPIDSIVLIVTSPGGPVGLLGDDVGGVVHLDRPPERLPGSLPEPLSGLARGLVETDAGPAVWIDPVALFDELAH